MTIPVAVLAGAVLALFSQQQSSTAVIGTILRVSSSEIRVKAAAETVAFRVNTDTEVYKSSADDDLTTLRPGDLVSVHAVNNSSGAAVATTISARRTTVRATVQKVNRAAGEILVSPDSGKAGGTRTVRYYPCTVFGASENALNPGAEILVVGLDFRDGGVDAATITIYHTDLPARRFR